MPKLPSFQFYPGDWLRDDVSGCSLEAQGLWLRMMIVMHDAQVYGQMILNNEPMSVEFVAKKIGISPKKYSNLLQELEFAGVINRKENGVIFSGRMERDERARQQNRERQRKHYNKPNGEPNADLTANITATSRQPNAKPNGASSSSSSSSNKNKKKEEELRVRTTASPSAPEPECKPADTRKDHPVIVTIREITNRFPPKEIWDELIDQVGINNINIVQMRKCYATWISRGFKKTNYDWIFDWYVNGRIPKAGNIKNGNFREQREQKAINEHNIIASMQRSIDIADGKLPNPNDADRPRQLHSIGADADVGGKNGTSGNVGQATVTDYPGEPIA